MPKAGGVAALPVLQHGFRPFFLRGAAWAALALFLWLAVLAGGLALPTAMERLAWYRHELLFGYLAAVIAAFLLTPSRPCSAETSFALTVNSTCPPADVIWPTGQKGP